MSSETQHFYLPTPIKRALEISFTLLTIFFIFLYHIYSTK